jgi:glyoxylase-like metal-dependent hydrolase (beta-lactamase superfamily II)
MLATQYGTASVHRVIDLDPFAIPLGFIFPGATIEALAPHRDLLAPTHVDFDNAAVLIAIQSHLIRFGGKTILLDACVGEHKARPLRPDWNQRTATSYLANLAAAGVNPDDVDMVMCTHLHADHVGWNTRLESGRWVPTFPKARYLVSQAEADHRAKEFASDPEIYHGSYRDSVLPILERGLFSFVHPGDEIVDRGRIVALPGHAPGQVGLELAAASDQHVLFCGDAIHSAVQILNPDWSSAFCHDRAQAAAIRRRLIERAAGENLRLLPAHLRGGCMRVHASGAGFCPVFEG